MGILLLDILHWLVINQLLITQDRGIQPLVILLCTEIQMEIIIQQLVNQLLLIIRQVNTTQQLDTMQDQVCIQ